METAGKRNKYPARSRFSHSMEFEESKIKPLDLMRMGIKKMKTAETKSVQAKIGFDVSLSAIFPPTKLPMESPRSVTPITDVHV